jgi:hypothetical protein
MMRRLLFWTEVVIVAGLTLLGVVQMLLSLSSSLWSVL